MCGINKEVLKLRNFPYKLYYQGVIKFYGVLPNWKMHKTKILSSIIK